MNQLMSTSLRLFILVFLTVVILSCSQGAKNEKLNVLFIAIDDMNDYTGFMKGHPQAQTPHMDRLSQQGVVFTNSFCSTAECNPSRASLLTGYHPKTTGFTNNFSASTVRGWNGLDEQGNDFAGYKNYPIPDMKNSKTIPQWFRENGYYSMGVGKIFHFHQGDKHVDRAFSWDEWGVVQGVPLFGNTGINQIYDGHIVWQDWGPVDVPTDSTEDFQRARWAARKLETYDRDEPFFLAVGFKKPHDPFYAPQEFFDMFPDTSEILLPPIKDDDLNDIPYMGRIMADHKEGRANEYEKVAGKNKLNRDLRKDAVRAYLATIAYVDHCVGEVLKALENSAFKDNTVVVLWSDHGLHLGEKLHYHKFTFWDEAIRNDLIIKVPGIKPGSSSANVSAIDLFPTLADICALPEDYLQPAFKKQGHSLRPLLEDPDKHWSVPVLVSNYKRFPPIPDPDKGEVTSDAFMAHGLRTENWKLIEYQSDDGQNEYELYDLKNDPNEWNNLALNEDYHTIRVLLTGLLHTFPGGEDGAQKQQTAPVVLPTPDAQIALLNGNAGQLEFETNDIDGIDEIQMVHFYDGEKLISSDQSYPFTVDFNGMEALRVVVVDQAGNKGEWQVQSNLR